MPQMTIRLERDPTTGKRNVVVDYKADDDALPLEHEQQHRALVDKLIEGGMLKAEELGKIIVEREAEQPVALPGCCSQDEEVRAEDVGN
jgi:hypothetical protein